MKIMGWIIAAGIVLLAVFAAANRTMLAASASLNFATAHGWARAVAARLAHG